MEHIAWCNIPCNADIARQVAYCNIVLILSIPCVLSTSSTSTGQWGEGATFETLLYQLNIERRLVREDFHRQRNIS
jgi:hypothetical protein